MKRCLLMVLVVLSLSLAMAQTFYWEDFSSDTFPPAGWTINGGASNWSAEDSRFARGTAPEARFSWTPVLNGTSRLISPSIDTTGETFLKLEFRHCLDYYEETFTIGIATRSNGGNWNTVYHIVEVNADIQAHQRTIHIENSDVGSSSFQFCFYFIGLSYNLDYWYIDNIRLYKPWPHDLAIMEVLSTNEAYAGVGYTPIIMIKNVGLNTLTSTVSMNVYQDDTLLQSNPDFYSTSMQEGYQTPVSFPDFIPPESNMVYRLEFSITSLEDVIDDEPLDNTMVFYINTWTGDKQNVLLEIATGTWCQYCPGAAMAADQFVDFGFNVAVIENHQGTGSTSDPYENVYSAGRNSYYGVTGFPTAFFDGVESIIGGSTTNMIGYYMPKYNIRSLVRTPLLMDIYGEAQDRDTYDVFVRINKLAATANPNSVLHFTVTESNITYSWQGQSHLNFINRLMLPDLGGTPLTLDTMANGEHDITYTLTPDPSWNQANLELVAFVQDLDTMEVLQAQKVLLPNLSLPQVANDDLLNSVSSALGRIYPNPFAGETNIEFSLKNSSPATLQIYNVKGQLVRTLMQESKIAGIHNLKWTGTDAQGQKVASGIYYIRLSQDGVTKTRKIMHLK